MSSPAVLVPKMLSGRSVQNRVTCYLQRSDSKSLGCASNDLTTWRNAQLSFIPDRDFPEISNVYI